MPTHLPHRIDRFEVVDGLVEIHGWVINETPISNVELIRNDGEIFEVQPSQYSIKSPDVENIFGINAKNSRFCISIPMSFFEIPKNLLHSKLKFSFQSNSFSINLHPKKESWHSAENNSLKIGIGVCTFNRKEDVIKTIENIKKFTNSNYFLFISDDGSSDETELELRNIDGISFVSGKNKGISWNKNRALYYLSAIKKCDVVILLEDDTRPITYGWEIPWINAALIHGHINLCPPWFPAPVSGAGTWDNPYLTKDLTAQCSAFSKEALNYAGYFDSRFKGYGHEHVEHTSRLIRLGYGGMKNCFLSLKSEFEFAPSQSHMSAESIERNRNLVGPLLQEVSYRSPWFSEQDLLDFREEMNSIITINFKE